MSEILIKNMALPKQGWKRLILLPDGEVREIGGDEAVMATDARAVEIPPHGRLGDLDLMKEDFDESLRATRQLVDLDSDSPFYGLQQRDLANADKLVNGLIDRTPTVLEASEVN